MAPNDRFTSNEHHDDARPRNVDLGWLRNPVIWLVAATAGIVMTFVGLAIEVWNGSSEQSLLTLSHPGQVTMEIGLALTTLGTLVALSVIALRRDRSSRLVAAVAGTWVLTAAVVIAGSVYIGRSGATVSFGGSTPASVAANQGQGATETSPEAAIAQGLKDNGITSDAPSSSGDSSAGGSSALAGEGADGTVGSAHDKGKQPTYTQIMTMSDADLLPLFPPDTMTLGDIPKLRAQLELTHQAAANLSTPDAARAAGYVRTTSDVPYMGQHWINFKTLQSGKFDPSQPDGLLFSKIDNSGQDKLVGVWWLLVPGIGGVSRAVAPQNTWAGNLALWHAHTGLCLVGFSGASEGETADSCRAKGGSYTPDLRWMMHVWVAPGVDNPQGVFGYLNNDLLQQQVSAGTVSAPGKSSS